MNPNVFNNSGAETDLFNILREKSINRFHSIKEIIDYKRNYRKEIENIETRIKNEIVEDLKKLSDELARLHDEYDVKKAEQTSLISKQIEEIKTKLTAPSFNIFSKIKNRIYKKKVNYLESNFDQIIDISLKPHLDKIKSHEGDIAYLTTHQNDVLHQRSNPFIREIEYIISELNTLSPLIYGCVGELKAIDLLRKLPDQYYIINDFRESFRPPLFYKSENDYIYSTQLDHIVIGPTGVYVIETKYWNQKSIESNDLFSPVKQLKRGGFALFVIINELIRNSNRFLSNWGAPQISVSNILLMMNSSTNQQYQFVKILTESNCIDYITKRPVVLNNAQIKFIVNRIS